MQITVHEGPGRCVDHGCGPLLGPPLRSISGIWASGSVDGKPCMFIGRFGPRPSAFSKCASPSGGAGPVSGGQVDRNDAGGVGRGPAQHVLGVRHRVVVAQDRRQDLRLVAQVQPSAAQVSSCGQGGVVEVLRIGHAVAVTVGGIVRPGARQELHRSHRTGIADPSGAGGLDDDLIARQRPVQGRSVDRSYRGAARIGGAAVGVPGLDTPDPGQQVPADAAAGVGGGHHPFGVAVRGQRHPRNTQRARCIHHTCRRRSRRRGRRDVETDLRVLDGDHQRAGRVGGGARDRGNRGDGGIAQRRLGQGERRCAGAVDAGIDQAGDHRHTECRAPGRAGQGFLDSRRHRLGGRRDGRGCGRNPYGVGRANHQVARRRRGIDNGTRDFGGFGDAKDRLLRLCKGGT